MANEVHVRILALGKEHWNRFRGQAQGVNPDLSGVNLSGANLRGFDFSGANLSEADLSDANLEGATFSMRRYVHREGADLSKANLSKANLRGANLTFALLSGTKFRGSILVEAQTLFAKFSACDFSGTDLSAVSGLTEQEIAGSVVDRFTKLPSYLRPCVCGGAFRAAPSSLFSSDPAQPQMCSICGGLAYASAARSRCAPPLHTDGKPITCPSCGLLNPASAQRCDCGTAFATSSKPVVVAGTPEIVPCPKGNVTVKCNKCGMNLHIAIAGVSVCPFCKQNLFFEGQTISGGSVAVPANPTNTATTKSAAIVSGGRKTKYRDSQKVRAFGWAVILLSIALVFVLNAVNHGGWAGVCLIVIGFFGIIILNIATELEREEEVAEARLQGPMAVEMVLARHRAEREQSIPRHSRPGNGAQLFARGRATQQFNSNLRSVGRLMSGNFGEGRTRTRRKKWW